MGIDPEELLLRLVHHACALYQCSPDAELALRGDGSGPEDLAMTVITRFLDPDDKTVYWGPARGKPTLRGLFSYLKRVLANDFLDRNDLNDTRPQCSLPPTGGRRRRRNRAQP